MDQCIVSSRGAYLDRNEFVAEAIWDRLNEDAARDGASIVPVDPLVTTVALDLTSEAGLGGTPHDDERREPAIAMPSQGSEVQPMAVVREAAAHSVSAPTLSRESVGGTIFGLHNRDLPTVWVVAHLAMMAVAEGGPVQWAVFVSRIRAEAQLTGSCLRDTDKRGNVIVKAAVGFPKPGEKARSSEDRFIGTALGAPSRTGLAGPALLLGLVASDERQEPRPAIAPTPEALDLLADLADAGFGDALPQPEAATRRWLAHVAACAPDDHAAWLEVLRTVADKPTRRELVARFPQWLGTTADTNTAGYVSRGREWGLVTPELLEGRYRLTPLGEHIVAEGNPK
jgi:hypothetical protein